jgi:hypothetical protein
MQISKSGILAAAAAIAVVLSFQATSGTSVGNEALVDRKAFDNAWSGEYYSEPAIDETPEFDNFESAHRHYLESPAQGVEEVEVDENGVPLNPTQGPVAPQPSPSPTHFPWILPSPTQFGTFPSFGPVKNPPPLRPSVVPSAVPSAVPSISDSLPQSFMYYNRGYLRNASRLEDEGKGFIKVFRDRTADEHGFAWGARSLIKKITEVAAAYSDRYPGFERLQIADIARETGGKLPHDSHQNGLDADIIYIRKTHEEQKAWGGYGKNGFAEEFVVSATSRVTKVVSGVKRYYRKTRTGVSENFDTEANFNLLMMFEKSGSTNLYIMDRFIKAEMHRYAEDQHLAKDPAVQSMLLKLFAAKNHADHFHLRLECQSTDSKCIDGVVHRRGPHHPAKKKRR